MRVKIFGISPGVVGQARTYDPIGPESGVTTILEIDYLSFNNTIQPTITVTAKDINGLRFKEGGATVILAHDAGADANISAVVDNDDGSYTATLTILNDFGGTINLSGTINTEVIENGPRVLNTWSLLPNVNTSTLTIDPTTVISNGVNQTLITLQLKDGNGDNITVGGETVNFFSTGAGSFTGRDPIDNGDGTYEQIYSADDLFYGDVTISAELSSVPIIDTAILTQTQPVGDVTTSLVFALPANIIADGVDILPVYLSVRDEDGIALTWGGDTVELFASNGASLTPVVDNLDGTYGANMTTSTPGLITVSASLNGVTVVHSQEVVAT